MSDPTKGVDDVVSAQTPQLEAAQRLQTYDLSKPIITLPNGVAIRHLRHSDAESLAKHADNIKISRNMSLRWPVPYTVDRSHDFISMCRNEASWIAIGPTDPKSNNTQGLGQKLPHAWAITLNDVAVGGVGFDVQKGIHARKLRFGYWLGEEFWGRGIMSVAISAFVDWLWRSYPWLVKLEPECYAWNKASARLLEKCGFVLEGRMRCSIERFGVVGDTLTYGMVREGVVSSNVPPEVAQ